jgi:hypothetical protein
MTRCFALRDYASNSKAKIVIFQLRDSALNWWGNLERQLHLTPDTVSWELFEERFRRKYLPSYYEEQQVGAFHALVQGNRTVEEYEIRFMELVKYVSYMDNDQRQEEQFVYGLNPKIRAMVRMWKPSSVAGGSGKCTLRGRTYELDRGYKTDIFASPRIRRKGPEDIS